MRNSEPNLYSALVSIRNVYVQTRWTQAQMVIVFHTVTIPIVVIPTTDQVLKFIVSCIGVLITSVGFSAIRNVIKRIDFLDCRLAELERLDAKSEYALRVSVFNSPKFREINHKGRKLEIFILILIIFWCGEILGNGYVLASLKHWI